MSKPDALALADRLEGRWALHPEMQEAAAELRRLHAAEKRGQRAEQLLKWALSSAEWREKRIYVCGGPPEQNWLLNVYLPIPADSDMNAEQALERALNDEGANHG